MNNVDWAGLGTAAIGVLGALAAYLKAATANKKADAAHKRLDRKENTNASA